MVFKSFNISGICRICTSRWISRDKRVLIFYVRPSRGAKFRTLARRINHNQEKIIANNTPNLSLLVSRQADIQSFATTIPHESFLKEEVLRFISIGGTVSSTFPNVATSIDERILSHILLRSAIENFFRLIYIFDNPYNSVARFESILNGFRRDYLKLFNSLNADFQSQIESADANWAALPGPPDLNSMLAQIRNTYGERLDYLYVIYRIGSFDTHGNSLNSLFEAVFSKKCNFPFLEIVPVIELIADVYYTLIEQLIPRSGP